ncbi:MAG: hypothetical protein KC619_19345 [Myxococcales bacterium]|nr:hypothetical protein [Myxococcales bacterium]
MKRLGGILAISTFALVGCAARRRAGPLASFFGIGAEAHGAPTSWFVALTLTLSAAF